MGHMQVKHEDRDKNRIDVSNLKRAIGIITLLFIMFVVLSIVYAVDDSRPLGSPDSEQMSTGGPLALKRNHNAFYQLINDHEYLLTALSDALASGAVCGPWCAAFGGMAGAADEAAIYFGFTDKRYLTWGLFGIATGHIIKPSIMSNIAGIVVGILLPTGFLNDHQEFVAPTISAIAGRPIGGTAGMISGGLAGVFDEINIRNGFADKHYMTFGTVGMAAANLLGYFNPAVADFIGVVLGTIAAEYEDQIATSFLVPVKTANDLYKTYNKFVPKEQVDTHIEKHALSLVGGQFLAQLLSLKVIEYQQGLSYNFERLDNPGGPAWKNFKSGLVNFAIFLFPYAIGQTLSSTIDDYFCKKLHFDLEDKVRAELFSGEIALRLSHDRNATVLVDNLRSDVSSIVDSGSGLMTSAVSTSISGAYGVGVIVVSSPNIFVYSALYSQAYSWVSEYLAAQQRVYGEKIIGLNSQLVSTLKHDTENIRTITERGGVGVTKEKVRQITDDLRELEGSQKIWSMINRVWWSIAGSVDFMFNYYLVGNEVNQGRVPFENRNKVQAANWQVSNVLSWSGRSAQDLAWMKQSLDRIVILEGKIHAQPENADQINRVVHDGNQLVLQDLEVGVEDRVLVTVKDLKLDMGKTYAVTGDTGCGKTSLLSKIRGIRENGVSGRGDIYYPRVNGKDPTIVMLSQQDYFPLDSSLQEVLSYPEKMPDVPALHDKKREEMLVLLKEIGLSALGITESKKSSTKNSSQDKQSNKKGTNEESLDLDTKKDWYTVLSGGEKKKILVVSAIIKKPDILILDEILNGLDSQSVVIVQQMLKKYLPNTLILIVDHHAKDNNYNSFYNKELNFSAKMVLFEKALLKT